MNHIFFIHSFVNGHFACFHVLAVVNSAVMNIVVYVSFQIMVFSGYTPRSVISGLYGSSILSFSRMLHTALQASQVVLVVKNMLATARDMRCEFDFWVRKILWRRAWKPTPVLLLGESPWTEEPGGLQFMGSQRVRHTRSDLA